MGYSGLAQYCQLCGKVAEVTLASYFTYTIVNFSISQLPAAVRKSTEPDQGYQEPKVFKPPWRSASRCNPPVTKCGSGPFGRQQSSLSLSIPVSLSPGWDAGGSHMSLGWDAEGSHISLGLEAGL